MSVAISELEPKVLWQHFWAITQIARPSKQEAAIRQYVLDWAVRLGHTAVVDDVGNVIVQIPATAGREMVASTVLQGHFDMVGEKNSDVVFDFQKDPIQPWIDGEWVRARGTTLGADNGIGLAAALAAADDPSVVHGPLELLFTVDEETGLTGAFNLSTTVLHSKRMLNLDSEEDGVLFVGCAGGGDSRIRLPITWRAASPNRKAYQLRVSGLRGGHSGLNIHENRANALRLLARMLDAARAAGLDLEVAALHGGDKHNAIPREAYAIVLLSPLQKSGMLSLISEQSDEFADEFAVIEPDMCLALETDTRPAPVRVFSAAQRDILINLLLGLPHGVVTMSRDIAGLVETSNNVASIRCENDQAVILTSSRSSVAAALRALRTQIQSVAGLAGACCELNPGYPGWKPNMASPLLRQACAVYAARFGKAPGVTAIHAGLECGVIGEKYPGMDMLSFGPEIKGAHSPDERVHVPSVSRFWDFLKNLLATLD